MSDDNFNEVLKLYQRAIERSREQDFDVNNGFADAHGSSERAQSYYDYDVGFPVDYSLRSRRDHDWQHDREDQKKQIENERLYGENVLRNKIGHTAIRLVWVQLFMCNLGFAAYVVYSFFKGWNIPSAVIIAWMSSSLVEIIGILWVIARSLFPFRDISRDEKAEKNSSPQEVLKK